MTAKIRPLWPYAPDGQPRPLPLPAAEKALRAATRAGFDQGERLGYTSGWRYGVICGLCAGVPLGMVAIWAAIEFGRMVAP